MKSEHIRPFVDAAMNAFSTMVGVPASPGKAYIRKPGEATASTYEICGLIGLSGAARGTVALGFNEAAARGIVAKFCGANDPSTLKPSDISDGVGELVNMVAGAAKAALYKGGGTEMINISIPNVVSGSNVAVVASDDYASVVIPFETPYGGFNVEVAFKVDKTAVH